MFVTFTSGMLNRKSHTSIAVALALRYGDDTARRVAQSRAEQNARDGDDEAAAMWRAVAGYFVEPIGEAGGKPAPPPLMSNVVEGDADAREA